MSGKKFIPNELFVRKSEDTLSKTSLSFMESLKAIVKSKVLLCRSLNILFQWFCAALGYQGTLYMATKLSGNPHFNFALSMIPSLPGTMMYFILPDRLGRRNTLALSEAILGKEFWAIHQFKLRRNMEKIF